MPRDWDALSDKERGRIMEQYVRLFHVKQFGLSLEQLLCSEDGFGLTTASPLQRAICRIASGAPLGDLATHEHVTKYVGDCTRLMGHQPAEMAIVSGIRTFKSMLAAAIGVHATQTCHLEHLSCGEIPRVSIVSLTKDLAQVVLRHLVGNILAKPKLKQLLMGDPTADTVILRHSSGRPVEIRVVAGSRAGASVVARWSAGLIFDEFTRMLGGDSAVVNYDDVHDAGKGRLLPGAQVISIGSPWAPEGPAWRIVNEYWLKPTRAMVCIKAPAPVLNPVWWTPERVASLKKTDPDVYRTDIDAQFLEPEEAFFSSIEVDASVRQSPVHIAYDSHFEYTAAMDPATRGNDWTLAIAARARNGKKQIVYTDRWQGSRAVPLSPDAVLREMAEALADYHLDICYSDQFAGDALKDIARRHGVNIVVQEWTRNNKVELYSRTKTEMADGQLELPPDPIVRADMLAVRRRVTNDGLTVVLPRTSDGRHADFAPAIVMALARWLEEPAEDIPAMGTKAYWDREARLMEEADEAEYEQGEGNQWW